MDSGTCLPGTSAGGGAAAGDGWKLGRSVEQRVKQCRNPMHRGGGPTPFEKVRPQTSTGPSGLTDKEASAGACVQPNCRPGDHVVFFPACFGDRACPPGSTSPTPLGIDAPASANVGEPVPVMVKRYNANGEASPAVGATVTGVPQPSRPTWRTRHTQLSQRRRVHIARMRLGIGSRRDHRSASTTATMALAARCPVLCQYLHRRVHPTSNSPVGTTLVKAGGVKSGHVYCPPPSSAVAGGGRRSPGWWHAASGALSLERRNRGRCFDFSGSRSSFVRIKCRQGRVVLFGWWHGVVQLPAPGAAPQGTLRVRHRGRRRCRSHHEARERSQPRCSPGQVATLATVHRAAGPDAPRR